jgi:hypothetical protein
MHAYLYVFLFIKDSSPPFLQYSGGHATEGQGGFYGSGGARHVSKEELLAQQKTDTRNKMLALAHDVEKITRVMQEVETLESALRSEDITKPTAKTMELKNSIKKIMTAPDVLEALNNLEINGEPVWGLSTDERELIMLAREKVNEC